MRKSAAFLDAWLKDPRGWQPGTQMPFFNLPDSTRRDLVAYLATLRGQAYAERRPWDAPAFAADPPRRGRELYERAGCGSCHGKEGAGGLRNNNVPGGTIPALRETASTFTRDELVRKLRLGVAKPQKEDPAGPEPMLAMPAWGEALREDELGALADYLLTLKPTSSTSPEW